MNEPTKATAWPRLGSCQKRDGRGIYMSRIWVSSQKNGLVSLTIGIQSRLSSTIYTLRTQIHHHAKRPRFIARERERDCITISDSSLPLIVRSKISQLEELKSAMGEHMDQMADLVEKLTAELRFGLRLAFDNFIGFFHAIDWTEPWLICLMSFHVVLLLVVIISRKNINFQMCLFLLALAGVYFAETLNSSLRDNWKSFAGQNYFDPQGLFLSVLWSGPLLVIAIIILVNTLFSLCYLIVRWKRAELRHRARLSHNKQD